VRYRGGAQVGSASGQFTTVRRSLPAAARSLAAPNSALADTALFSSRRPRFDMAFRPPRADPAPLSVAALVAVNLLPLVGALFWGWSLLDILLIYWLESGIVGLLNVPEILLASGAADGSDGSVELTVNDRRVELVPPTTAARPTLHSENVPLAGFFCLHYGIFWVVHGAFVLTFGLWAPRAFDPVDPSAVALGAASLLVSHTASFVVNYVGAEEYREVTPMEQLFRPYGRVFVLHLTIIFGAILVSAFGAPALALAVLVLLKTALDLGAHVRDHRRAVGPIAPSGQ
jgi:hypothetical protein